MKGYFDEILSYECFCRVMSTSVVLVKVREQVLLRMYQDEKDAPCYQFRTRIYSTTHQLSKGGALLIYDCVYAAPGVYVKRVVACASYCQVLILFAYLTAYIQFQKPSLIVYCKHLLTKQVFLGAAIRLCVGEYPALLQINSGAETEGG